MWRINSSVITQLPLWLHMAVALNFEIIVQGAMFAFLYLREISDEWELFVECNLSNQIFPLYIVEFAVDVDK